MVTLRESAEKLASEALACGCAGYFGNKHQHFAYCNTAAALSAVLKGMKLVLQGTPHLHGNTTDPRQATMQCDRKGGWEECPYHSPDVCARLGGACRLKELE